MITNLVPMVFILGIVTSGCSWLLFITSEKNHSFCSKLLVTVGFVLVVVALTLFLWFSIEYGWFVSEMSNSTVWVNGVM